MASADLDATFDRLVASAAEVIQEPTAQPYGVREAVPVVGELVGPQHHPSTSGRNHRAIGRYGNVTPIVTSTIDCFHPDATDTPRPSMVPMWPRQ